MGYQELVTKNFRASFYNIWDVPWFKISQNISSHQVYPLWGKIDHATDTFLTHNLSSTFINQTKQTNRYTRNIKKKRDHRPCYSLHRSEKARCAPFTYQMSTMIFYNCVLCSSVMINDKLQVLFTWQHEQRAPDVWLAVARNVFMSICTRKQMKILW